MTTGKPLRGRAASLAQTKREALHGLYRHDVRVTPWAGTAHGVLQAVNTYEHHIAGVRGGSRSGRNQLRAVTGSWDSLDRQTWFALEKILVRR